MIDLAATDVLRVRERGVPRYNDFRELFHKPRVRSFEELTGNPETAAEVEAVYEDIDRVDLMIGLYSEPLPKGFGFSDTAFRVFVLMASRRPEERRFFTRDFRPDVYSPTGFRWVRDTTMKDVSSATAPRWRPRCKASRMRSPPGGAWRARWGAPARGGAVVHRAAEGGRAHAFLCEDGGELTLVDTLYDLDGARIPEQIRRIGRQPSALRRIVLTHGHRSHLGGLAALKEASGATVYAHEWEADIIGGERKAQPISFLPHRPFRRTSRSGLSLGIGAHPPCPVDEFVAGGDLGPLEVLDAPGHSPGHLAFLWADRRALIAGDSIATWPSFMAGWAAFNLNVPKHRATIRRSRRRNRRPSASATARRSHTARRRGSATSRTPSHGSARVCSVRARDRPGQEPRGGQVRLAPALAPDVRAELVIRMLDAVAAACRNASAITDVLVVTPEPALARRAESSSTRAPTRAGAGACSP